MNEFERSTLRWAKVAVLMSFLAALFVCLQWCEMHTGAADTHDLAVKAGKQADAAKTLADQAKAQTDKMADSIKLARRTLGVFETQQRAWIGLAAPPKLRPAQNGVIWTLRNFGNSPAFHIAAKGINVGHPGEISAAQDSICREIGTGVGGTWELLFPGEIGRPRAAFVVGAPIVYIIGCIKYRDQFSLSRWTKFCFEPDSRDSDAYISCLGYNSTDADESGNSCQPPD